MIKNIAVFCGSHFGKNPIYKEVAEQLGTRLASEGRTLIYGGSAWGYMGSVSSAALNAGGYVVGIIPTIFSDAVISSQPVSELIKVQSMAERKQIMAERSDAYIALPGGIGTLDEISEMLTNTQLGFGCKPTVILNVNGFYNPLKAQLELMHNEGLIQQGTMRTILFHDTVDELLQQLDNFVANPENEFLEKIRR